jgi:hypothetical protein
MTCSGHIVKIFFTFLTCVRHPGQL